MSERGNHHYVPQFYFRYFSTNSRSICLLNRASGATIPEASVRGQASKSRFYGKDEVERALGNVEGACSGALRKLVEHRDPMRLDHQDVTLILTWLALQRSRTMAARHMGKPMHDKVLKLYLEMTISNDTELSADQRSEYLSSLDSIAANPVQSQLVDMKVAMEAAANLSDLQPILLVNRTNRPYIFSDAPVILYNGYYRKVTLRGVLGFDTPGLMVLFPLGPSLQLMLFDAACYGVRRVRDHQIHVRELKDIASLNKLQIHSASNCIYFHEFKFAPYVTELWRQERAKLVDHAGVIVEAPGLDANTGEPMGDIVHTFQPQLPFVLTLSFLQHQVVGDDSYQFERRSKRRLT